MKHTDNLGKFGTLIGSSASSSDIASIPDTQGTPGDGTASIALAFPPETFIARAAGGEPPRGQDMNGFLNLLSAAIQPLQAGYLGPFDADFAASIGGYPLGAIVSGSSVGIFWVSTADANTTVPGASGASWQSLFKPLQDQVAGCLLNNNPGITGTGSAIGTSLCFDGTYAFFAYDNNSKGIELAPVSMVTTLAGNLTTESTTRANQFAALSADISNCVTGNTTTNVAITNIQMVDFTGTDNSSAYVQVATPAGFVSVPTVGFASGLVSAETTARENADTALNTQITNSASVFVNTAASMNVTVPSWATRVEIEGIGAGGGGGGCQGTSTSDTISGAGGGSGGYIRAVYPVSGGDTLEITIGAGGNGGVGASPGGTGGTTTVSQNGTLLFSLTGATGGSKPTTANTSGGAGGGLSVAVGGNVVGSSGTDGSDGQAATWVFAGNGAPSPHGGGGRAGAGGGHAANGSGAGGGGAYDSGLTGNSYNGGAGGSALISYRFLI